MIYPSSPIPGVSSNGVAFRDVVLTWIWQKERTERAGSLLS